MRDFCRRRLFLGARGAVWIGAMAAVILIGASAPAGLSPARAASAALGVKLGPSGLPVPRFVSLKAGRVNVRSGPGEDYKVAWIFTKPGLPIEIVQEFDNWRRIRDSDGAMGWVFHSLLAGKRTAVIAPWAKDGARPLRGSPDAASAITAYLEPGVLAGIDSCQPGWCRLRGEGFRGWIPQDQLWGVYPGEEID